MSMVLAMDMMSMPVVQEMIKMVLQRMDVAEVLLDLITKDFFRITICITVTWFGEHQSWSDHSAEKAA